MRVARSGYSRFLTLGSALSLLAVLLFALPAQAAPARGAGPEAAPGGLFAVPAVGEVIPGRYIVVLKDGVDADAFAASQGVRPALSYRQVLNGFAANLSAGKALGLARNPNVALIEPDRVMSTQGIPSGIDRMDVDENTTAAIAGDGGNAPVNIAVLDTGVDIDHSDLNVAGGAGFAGSGFWIFWTCDNGTASYDDGHGHGTHVAGTIGALDDGVDVNSTEVVGAVPGANIYGVKVLTNDGTGATSCIIDGVEWVTQRKAEFNDGAGDGDPGIDFAVANMSLGGGSSTALCNAVNASVNAGVVYAVAAGNDAANASGSSPANCSGVITVSAIADFDGDEGGLTDQTVTFSSCTEDKDDSLACFSNYGSTVEVAAPGVSITSTFRGGGYAVSSGTSMAAPHVAGAVALFKLATGYSGTAWGPDVIATMTAAGWTVPQSSACGFTQDVDGYAEPLIYTGTSCNGAPPPPPPPPVNTPPVVEAGADQSIVLPATVNLGGTVTDDGLPGPYTVQWTASGPGTVTFGNASAEDTTASFSSAGVYVLTLTADDGEFQVSDSLAVTVSDPPSPPSNEPPVVDAGADQSIELPASVNLDGTVTDDGSYTVVWTASGQGTVTFGNAMAEDTTASFSSAGTYQLTLTADDGEFQVSDSLTVTVSDPPPPPPPGGDGSLSVAVSLSGRSATSYVTVFDSAGATVEGATVNGEWTIVTLRGTIYRTRTAVTDASGVATTSSGNLGRWWLSVMYCPTSITGVTDPVNPVVPDDCVIVWR